MSGPTLPGPEVTAKNPLDETCPHVEFWFDPICPWAWITSRWLLEVARHRDLEIDWHVMSLAYLNHGRDLDPGYRKSMDTAWGPVRVVVAAIAEHGPQVALPLYTAIGTRLHDRGEGKTRERRDVLIDAIAEVELSPALIDAMDSTDYDGALKEAYDTVVALVGDEVGTPTISVDGVAFFGPVVTPIPRGEDAVRLWDGVLQVAHIDGFFELKRTRTRAPIFT